MAQVYGPPSNVQQPPIGGISDWENYRKQCARYVSDLQALAKKNGKNELLGEIYRTPMGDGYAEYIVWRTKPLELVHLKIGDAWRAPAPLERGLRLADIKMYVESERRWTALTTEMAL